MSRAAARKESLSEVGMKTVHKLGAAVSVVLITVLGVRILGDSIYMAAAPDEPPRTGSFPIPSGMSRDASASAAPVELRPGDAALGKKVVKVCAACHSFKQGGKNKVGPNLFGIYGSSVANVSGFSYSSALASHGGRWTADNLEKWLTKPKDFIPGNKMSFAGFKADVQKTRDVVAYLKSLQ